MCDAVIVDDAASHAARLACTRHSRLRSTLRKLDAAVASAAAAAAAPSSAINESLPPSISANGSGVVDITSSAVDARCPPANSANGSNFVVEIGTTEMVQHDATLVHRIATMVNTAYFEQLKELLPAGTTSYERICEEDVYDRLEMGDAGARANRVLHLAKRDGQLVGACSSTFQPPCENAAWGDTHAWSISMDVHAACRAAPPRGVRV